MDTNPLQQPRTLLVVDQAVFLFSFLIYLLTTSPTVNPGDSGEFIASAFCLGNPHNSGYPLYALAGKIFCMIPLGSMAFRMNCMSACFGALTVWLTYRIVLKLTQHAIVPACSAALMLAFSATFWSQTACSEVYIFHAFFVALIVALLFSWHETRSLSRLLVFAFVVALSFGNHMQTIMLAPAVFMFILWSDGKILLNLRHFLLLAFFFILGLSVYLYLPIRTDAGAAIHWGDPNTLSRFMHHVGAGDHRHAYVLNKSWDLYITRFLGVLKETYSQYHVFWLLAFWGWLTQQGLKWKAFWGILFFCDCIYTVFLNIISTEITAFQIPSSVFGAILIGLGLDQLLQWISRATGKNAIWIRCARIAAFCFPAVLLATNLYQNDQHENYTAYEFGTNVLRSAWDQGTLLMEGDNLVFPITYLALVENARPDLALYDRHNLFFKMPFLYREGPTFTGKWEELRRIIEDELVESGGHVYIATFNEKVISDRGFDLIPHGLVSRAIPSEKYESALREAINPWPSYMTESFNSTFWRDYMTRTVTGYFFFKMARDLILRNQEGLGASLMKKASSIAYNDRTLHGDIASFYVDMGMLDEAKEALGLFSKYTNKHGLLHNMWGYYYAKAGNVDKAIVSFEKSVHADPSLFDASRNLGLMYLEKGAPDLARQAFEKSLLANPKQPSLIRLMQSKGW